MDSGFFMTVSGKAMIGGGLWEELADLCPRTLCCSHDLHSWVKMRSTPPTHTPSPSIYTHTDHIPDV